jgi:hypothetical protein
MRCQHKPRRGKDLVTDVSGTQYLLFSCVLCGCDVSVKPNWEGQPIEEILFKREKDGD